MILYLLACGADPAPTAPAPAPRAELPPLPEPLPRPADAPADIVLVSIDTLRPDHLGAYGYERETSPFIDLLAREGVRFAHARSASPWTLPAHTTMLTGQLPTTHRVVEDDLRLPDSVPVLPEKLQAAGMHTGAAVATLFVSSMYRFDRGFEHFEDFDIHNKKVNLQGVVDTRGVVDDLAAYVRSVPRGEPIFLFLHTYDAHYAYDPPPPYDTLFDRAPRKGDLKYKSYYHYKKKPVRKPQMKHQVAQYDESIRYVDDQLARLARVFAEQGRSPRWVITADHGEEFGERGSWGHAHTLYAEQLRIPLVMSGPGIPAGVVVEEPVGNHDIAPTLAAWAGVELPDPDGIDLTPFLDGESTPPERPFLAETSRHGTIRLGLYEAGQRLEWALDRNTTEVFTTDDERNPASVDALPLKKRAVELLGNGWSSSEDGFVKVRKGRILRDGEAAQRGPVAAGERFGVFPLDAQVAFGKDASSVGQGAASAGGPAPVAPLSFLGAPRPLDVDLDAATKRALESIGYIHGDE